MKAISKIVVEKYNTSDIEYKIVDIYINNMEKISYGDKLFSLESSKTIIDIEATSSGWLLYNFQLNQIVKVGDIIALIYDEKPNENITSIELEKIGVIKQNSSSNFHDKFSKKAFALINESSVDISIFDKFEIVKESDVIEYLELKNRKFIIPSKSKQGIILIGGMGGAKMCIDAIESTREYDIVGIIDDQMKPGTLVMNNEVLGGENELIQMFENGFQNILITYSLLSDLKRRSYNIEKLKKIGFNFPNIIHKHANIEPSAKIGIGNIILAGSILGSECQVGDFNYINTGSIICHEAIVGNNNHFAPNSVIAGRVKIENNNLFGICSTTYFDISIGSNNVLNNGVNLNSNLSDNNIIRK
jgi:UDP-perosamine 4-acetyltransferase